MSSNEQNTSNHSTPDVQQSTPSENQSEKMDWVSALAVRQDPPDFMAQVRKTGRFNPETYHIDGVLLTLAQRMKIAKALGIVGEADLSLYSETEHPGLEVLLDNERVPTHYVPSKPKTVTLTEAADGLSYTIDGRTVALEVKGPGFRFCLEHVPLTVEVDIGKDRYLIAANDDGFICTVNRLEDGKFNSQLSVLEIPADHAVLAFLKL